MIELDVILPSQDVIRNRLQIAPMTEFIRRGGFWTPDVIRAHAEVEGADDKSLISVNCFEDGKFLLQNGHHRVVSTFRGGRNFLRDDEYQIVRYSYQEYDEINFAERYVTPFDPVNEVRLGDFKAFKEYALELAKTDEEAAIAYIRSNKALYCRRRKYWSVAELAASFDGTMLTDSSYDVRQLIGS